MMVTPRSTRNASSRPGRSQARFAFIILFTINVLNYADRYVLPAILPKARQDLGLTTIEEGLLGSSFLLVYGLTTLPLGVCADRGVRKNIIGLCVGVWSVATTLGGLSRNFWQLISARTVLGIGEAGYGPASLSLLGDFFTKAQRGRVLSYWSVGNLVGTAIGFMFGGLVIALFAIGGISLSFCTRPIFASVIGLIADRYTLSFALITTTPTFLFLAGLACLVGARTVARDMRRMQEQMRDKI